MSPAHEPPVAPDSDVAAPSKTRRKQAMHALQDLGEALVALDPKRLAELEPQIAIFMAPPAVRVY
jgi:ribosomal 50S subunit-associated protein YjgA (DUF615 family)